ncbi:hypothetical protein NDU88_001990 [Pleurodeles waltl]|uniref:L1 transposable element RRM domain-containing protein n=1 Tax=Pleurodeles waltl TaxID=8319 RepID=A0AAV7P7H7_PLEWA|nr:hypothetical protein NDU88_001990 [Pleurodeles waltl]
MDAAITSLTLETKSMRSEIAGFQSRVTGLEHRVVTLESHMNTVQDRDQDLLYLCSKITDLEDRNRRDNVRVFGFPENEEGPGVQALLRSDLPKLTALTFDLPLEFQWAYRLGLRRPGGASRPRPIIACLLRHGQARQLLQAARTHGHFRPEGYDVRTTADYSKDTNDHQKAFLASRPRLRQLEMKYSLFDPARMWATKNGVSKDFYDPEDLRLFLDTFQHQPMDTATPARPQEQPKDSYNRPPPGSQRGEVDPDHLPRGRDLTRTHDNRGQILQAVVLHTQLSERDKSCSPLKPAPVPT